MRELLNKVFVRIQNPKVLLATISGVLLVLTNTGVLTVENARYVTDILNTVFTLFVGLGVFGNPESHLLPPVYIQAPIEASLAPVAPVAPVVSPVPVYSPTLETAPINPIIAQTLDTVKPQV